MALLHVNPTRMELTKLKKRLKTARRGHRLLKDKRDELMKQFLLRIHENHDLRIRVDAALMEVHKSFRIAAALMSPEVLNQSLMLPKQSLSITTKPLNIMSVNVPVYTVKSKNDDPLDNYPYGFLTTISDLDDAILRLSLLQPDLMRLIELEKSTQLMALEIEKTRRRVNALEYVLIPQLTDTIRTITMKLDENDRGNLSRLMKVKEMIVKQALSEAYALHDTPSKT